jgi:hypothetical protein
MQHQLAQMDLIYAQSALTIIAACGKDPSYSLPGVGKRCRRDNLPRTVSDHYIFQPIEYSLDWIIKEASWASRGWYVNSLCGGRDEGSDYC